MNFKEFWKKSFGGLILKNILAAIAIIIILVWITLWGINKYTNHGVSETVPDLRGSYVEEAEVLLAQQGLYPKIIDSVYISGKRLGSIVEQIPLPGSIVKKNRPIFLVVNSRQVRPIPLPDITDVSFRQAEAMLNAIGLRVGKVEYTPSEYKNLVIDVLYLGKSVPSGTRIPEGASLVLVVGQGLGDHASRVPSLKGLNLENGRTEAISSSYIIGAAEYDKEPHGNEAEYVIYRQHPSAGRSVPIGSRIDVWLSTDRSMLDKIFEDEDDNKDEQFF